MFRMCVCTRMGWHEDERDGEGDREDDGVEKRANPQFGYMVGEARCDAKYPCNNTTL